MSRSSADPARRRSACLDSDEAGRGRARGARSSLPGGEAVVVRFARASDYAVVRTLLRRQPWSQHRAELPLREAGRRDVERVVEPGRGSSRSRPPTSAPRSGASSKCSRSRAKTRPRARHRLARQGSSAYSSTSFSTSENAGARAVIVEVARSAPRSRPRVATQRRWRCRCKNWQPRPSSRPSSRRVSSRQLIERLVPVLVEPTRTRPSPSCPPRCGRSRA